jgi:hypothetical protein
MWFGMKDVDAMTGVANSSCILKVVHLHVVRFPGVMRMAQGGWSP